MKSREIEKQLIKLKEDFALMQREFIIQLCKDLNIHKIKIDYEEQYDDNNYYNHYFISKINDIEFNEDDDFDLYMFDSMMCGSLTEIPDKLKSFLIISNIKEDDFCYFGKSILSLDDAILLNIAGTEISIEQLVTFNF
jgi:hypothetical protein